MTFRDYWSKVSPLDAWYRKKYNIPFNSREHRETRLVDIRIMWGEYILEVMEERRKHVEEYVENHTKHKSINEFIANARMHGALNKVKGNKDFLDNLLKKLEKRGGQKS